MPHLLMGYSLIGQRYDRYPQIERIAGTAKMVETRPTGSCPTDPKSTTASPALSIVDACRRPALVKSDIR
jgi:hypothetical protein